MKIGSLFSGYGGLDLAAERHFNAETAWQAEWETAPSTVLAHHWPGVPNLKDVTQVDWAAVEPVDIITGGFPCQDVSAAGKRAGMVEGTRSNLWGAMRTAIEVIRPQFVVAENVRGLLSATAQSDSDLEPNQGFMGNETTVNLRALGRVLGDLADLGYDAQWHGILAADIGAPHNRFRVFIFATDALNHRQVRQHIRHEAGKSDTKNPGLHHTRTACSAAENGARTENGAATDTTNPGRFIGTIDDVPTHARATGTRSGITSESRSISRTTSGTAWGNYEPAIRRWEYCLQRPAPRPTEPTGKDGAQQLSAKFVEWMMGLPEGWVTDVPEVSRANQIKMLGNGVVPQQAAHALKIMTERWKEIDN